MPRKANQDLKSTGGLVSSRIDEITNSTLAISMINGSASTDDDCRNASVGQDP